MARTLPNFLFGLLRSGLRLPTFEKTKTKNSYSETPGVALRRARAVKASSNMLTAGAAAPAVKPPAPAVESKLWHCGGQAVS